MRYVFAHARREQTWSDLTYQQYSFLRVLDVYGASSPAIIARHLLVAAPSVTRTSAALVDAGLVERHADASDRRAIVLDLTRLGRRRVRAMRRELLAVIRDLIEPLPSERIQALDEALEELSTLLHEVVWNTSAGDYWRRLR